MGDPHLDHALEGEFAGQSEAIHKLKVSDTRFRILMERNHALWKEIQHIQQGLEAADDVRLETLRKQRLHVLDEIAAALRSAP